MMVWIHHFTPILAEVHTITLYLPNSVLLLFLMGFVGLLVIFKVVTYLISLLPFT